MMLKALTAATLLALSSIALAQSTGADTSGASVSGSAAGGVDLTNKCIGLLGAEREKCLLDQRSGAAAGATIGGSASPAIGTTTPAPLTTPGSPTNPTMLPGSSTTPKQ